MSPVSERLIHLHRSEIDGDDPPVTVVRDIRIHDGRHEEFERLISIVIEEAMHQEGYLGAIVLRPMAPGDPYRFVYRFDRRSALEKWHKSDVRVQAFRAIESLIEFDRPSEYAGLETWLNLPLAWSPPKWKTTFVSWLAIYPAVLLGLYVMQWVGFNPPKFVGAFVLTAAVVPLVSYVLAPALAHLLRSWLRENSSGINI